MSTLWVFRVQNRIWGGKGWTVYKTGGGWEAKRKEKRADDCGGGELERRRVGYICGRHVVALCYFVVKLLYVGEAGYDSCGQVMQV